MLWTLSSSYKVGVIGISKLSLWGVSRMIGGRLDQRIVFLLISTVYVSKSKMAIWNVISWFTPNHGYIKWHMTGSFLQIGKSVIKHICGAQNWSSCTQPHKNIGYNVPRKVTERVWIITTPSLGRIFLLSFSVIFYFRVSHSACKTLVAFCIQCVSLTIRNVQTAEVLVLYKHQSELLLLPETQGRDNWEFNRTQIFKFWLLVDVWQ